MPRAAWILFGGTFINRFGGFVMVFLVFYLTDRGYSPTEAGLAVSAYGGGALLASATGGLLADRLGRRLTISLSMFGSAAAVMALSQASALWLVILLTGVAGMAAEAYRPAASALLADLVPPERRFTAFALMRLAVNAGFAAGPAVAGLLASESFFLLFVGDAATSVAYGVIAFFMLPEGVRSKRQDEVRGEATKAILRDRSFLIFLAASLIAGLVYLQSQATFALHVRGEGFSEAVYGALFSLNGVMIVVLELGIVSVTQRLPATRVMAVGYILVGAGFGLLALAHSLPILILTVVIWTLGEIVGAPVANAYLASLAPPHLRGRYNGAFGLCMSVAFIIAPTLGTWVFERSPTALWVGTAVLGVVSAGLILLAREQRVQPTIARPEHGPEVAGVET